MIDSTLAGATIPSRPVASRTVRGVHAVLRFCRRQPLGAACAAIVILFVLLALLAGVVAPYGATENNVGPSLAGPSSGHWFGTDNYGRDLLSRVIYGARVSLTVGFGATLIATIIGTALGAISGYVLGVVDFVIQRVVDAAQAVPPLIMLIGIMVVLGPSERNVIIALALRGGLTLARVIRGAVISIRGLTYIDAARASGVAQARILMRHILPNIMPTVIVLFSISIGANIVAEAGLSFLGYGVPPPAPTWGGMMSAEGRSYMLVNPWLLLFPTLALAAVVFTMNMFGDALRDELDPRLRSDR